VLLLRTLLRSQLKIICIRYCGCSNSPPRLNRRDVWDIIFFSSHNCYQIIGGGRLTSTFFDQQLAPEIQKYRNPEIQKYRNTEKQFVSQRNIIELIFHLVKGTASLDRRRTSGYFAPLISSPQQGKKKISAAYCRCVFTLCV
jgi:hypothetical protein